MNRESKPSATKLSTQGNELFSRMIKELSSAEEDLYQYMCHDEARSIVRLVNTHLSLLRF